MTALELRDGKICLLEDRDTSRVKMYQCTKLLPHEHKQVERPLIQPDTA
jgi:hypothetical protein